MKKKIILAVVALVVILAGAVWFDLPARLGLTGHQSALTLFGNVDIRQVQLAFRVNGKVAEMLVDEGDAVKRGQVIARLDRKPYLDALAAAAAQAAERQAAYDKLVAGPRKGEIEAARANFDKQVASSRGAELDFVRAKALQAQDAISKAAYDKAATARDETMASVQSSRETLRLLEDGNRAEDIAAGKADLEAALASRSAAETALNDTEIRAPADGVILSRVREPGAIVATNDIVFVLSLNKPVWVRAYVPEEDLGRIHPGMAVDVTTDSAPNRPYRGIVGYISPVAEFTPKSVETAKLRTDLVYRLRVVVDRPDEGLRQGMPVTIRVPLDGTR
jgi:HlyD family secretion protein